MLKQVLKVASYRNFYTIHLDESQFEFYWVQWRLGGFYNVNVLHWILRNWNLFMN